jgi:hypothetical protein
LATKSRISKYLFVGVSSNKPLECVGHGRLSPLLILSDQGANVGAGKCCSTNSATLVCPYSCEGAQQELFWRLMARFRRLRCPLKLTPPKMADLGAPTSSRNPRKLVFDLRAHFCHSAPWKRTLSASDSGPTPGRGLRYTSPGSRESNPREGQKRFPISCRRRSTLQVLTCGPALWAGLMHIGRSDGGPFAL